MTVKVLNKISLFFFVCILLSCTKQRADQYEHYTDFPVEKPLVATVIPLDTALFRYPFRIDIKDSVAIIMDLHNRDYYFHAFAYPEFKHLVSFGKRGGAPDEMLSAENFRFNSLDSVWVLDANKMKMTRWRISPANCMATQQEVIPLDKKLMRSLDFVLTSDSQFLIPDYTGQNRFARVDRLGAELEKKGEIPTEEEEVPETSRMALAQAWRSFIDYNRSDSIVALVTQLGEVLEIYNLKDSTRQVVYGPNGEPRYRVSKGYGIPAGILGFNDICITSRYIYAVFQGRSLKERAQRKGERIDGGQYIYVFSFDGKPVCKYTLDHYIYGIDVNEDKGIITALDVNSDEPILEFRI